MLDTRSSKTLENASFNLVWISVSGVKIMRKLYTKFLVLINNAMMILKIFLLSLNLCFTKPKRLQLSVSKVVYIIDLFALRGRAVYS